MSDLSFTYRCRKGKGKDKGKNKGFVLTSEWTVLIDEGWVQIPTGFLSDLASIPRLLWWIPGLAPMEFGAPAPVMHDWAYQHDGQLTDDIHVTRKRADQLFRTLARADGNGRLRCRVAWVALRLFGWLAFRRLPTREAALRLAQ